MSNNEQTKEVNREIRQTQAISPFGAGSIFTLRGESFIFRDIGFWTGSENFGNEIGDSLKLNRLAYRHGLEGFRSPPVKRDDETGGDKIPAQRFPRWLFCPQCDRMEYWSYMREKDLVGVPRCSCCSKKPQLSPVRFVSVCPNGHLQDIPWAYWVHKVKGTTEKQKRCQHEDKLKYHYDERGGGSLYAIRISCEECGASGTVGELAATKPVPWKCSGKQPWEKDGTDCNGTRQNGDGPVVRQRVIQRGASNVTEPVVDSAIDIPPAALFANRHNNHPYTNEIEFKNILKDAQSNPNWEKDHETELFLMAKRKRTVPSHPAAIVKKILGEIADEEEKPQSENDLRWGEWKAFQEPPDQPDQRDDFIVDREDHSWLKDSAQCESDSAQHLLHLLNSVRSVRKLREVRCLLGFSRIGSKSIPVDMGKGLRWRPAVELFGEGIFFSFDHEKVSEWESRYLKSRRDQFQTLVRRFEDSSASEWENMPTVLTPKFVALHTLSHLLMRQLAFECGYGASSLCEKIYCGDGDTPMAGILIHTGENSSDGSMGGLVRQAKPDRLIPTILTATKKGTWCSNDPLCREISQRGRDGLNAAACHACCLVAETSCPYGNLLLDRQVLLSEEGLLPTGA